eukprot:gene4074-14169_t
MARPGEGRAGIMSPSNSELYSYASQSQPVCDERLRKDLYRAKAYNPTADKFLSAGDPDQMPRPSPDWRAVLRDLSPEMLSSVAAAFVEFVADATAQGDPPFHRTASSSKGQPQPPSAHIDSSDAPTIRREELSYLTASYASPTLASGEAPPYSLSNHLTEGVKEEELDLDLDPTHEVAARMMEEAEDAAQVKWLPGGMDSRSSSIGGFSAPTSSLPACSPLPPPMLPRQLEAEFDEVTYATSTDFNGLGASPRTLNRLVSVCDKPSAYPVVQAQQGGTVRQVLSPPQGTGLDNFLDMGASANTVRQLVAPAATYDADAVVYHEGVGQAQGQATFLDLGATPRSLMRLCSGNDKTVSRPDEFHQGEGLVQETTDPSPDGAADFQELGATPRTLYRLMSVRDAAGPRPPTRQQGCFSTDPLAHATSEDGFQNLGATPRSLSRLMSVKDAAGPRPPTRQQGATPEQITAAADFQNLGATPRSLSRLMSVKDAAGPRPSTRQQGATPEPSPEQITAAADFQNLGATPRSLSRLVSVRDAAGPRPPTRQQGSTPEQITVAADFQDLGANPRTLFRLLSVKDVAGPRPSTRQQGATPMPPSNPSLEGGKEPSIAADFQDLGANPRTLFRLMSARNTTTHRPPTLLEGSSTSTAPMLTIGEAPPAPPLPPGVAATVSIADYERSAARTGAPDFTDFGADPRSLDRLVSGNDQLSSAKPTQIVQEANTSLTLVSPSQLMAAAGTTPVTPRTVVTSYEGTDPISRAGVASYDSPTPGSGAIPYTGGASYDSPTSGPGANLFGGGASSYGGSSGPDTTLYKGTDPISRAGVASYDSPTPGPGANLFGGDASSDGGSPGPATTLYAAGAVGCDHAGGSRVSAPMHGTTAPGSTANPYRGGESSHCVAASPITPYAVGALSYDPAGGSGVSAPMHGAPATPMKVPSQSRWSDEAHGTNLEPVFDGVAHGERSRRSPAQMMNQLSSGLDAARSHPQRQITLSSAAAAAVDASSAAAHAASKASAALAASIPTHARELHLSSTPTHTRELHLSSTPTHTLELCSSPLPTTPTSGLQPPSTPRPVQDLDQEAGLAQPAMAYAGPPVEVVKPSPPSQEQAGDQNRGEEFAPLKSGLVEARDRAAYLKANPTGGGSLSMNRTYAFLLVERFLTEEGLFGSGGGLVRVPSEIMSINMDGEIAAPVSDCAPHTVAPEAGDTVATGAASRAAPGLTVQTVGLNGGSLSEISQMAMIIDGPNALNGPTSTRSDFQPAPPAGAAPGVGGGLRLRRTLSTGSSKHSVQSCHSFRSTQSAGPPRERGPYGVCDDDDDDDDDGSGYDSEYTATDSCMSDPLGVLDTMRIHPQMKCESAAHRMRRCLSYGSMGSGRSGKSGKSGRSSRASSCQSGRPTPHSIVMSEWSAYDSEATRTDSFTSEMINEFKIHPVSYPGPMSWYDPYDEDTRSDSGSTGAANLRHSMDNSFLGSSPTRSLSLNSNDMRRSVDSALSTRSGLPPTAPGLDYASSQGLLSASSMSKKFHRLSVSSSTQGAALGDVDSEEKEEEHDPELLGLMGSYTSHSHPRYPSGPSPLSSSSDGSPQARSSDEQDQEGLEARGVAPPSPVPQDGGASPTRAGTHAEANGTGPHPFLNPLLQSGSVVSRGAGVFETDASGVLADEEDFSSDYDSDYVSTDASLESEPESRVWPTPPASPNVMAMPEGYSQLDELIAQAARQALLHGKEAMPRTPNHSFSSNTISTAFLHISSAQAACDMSTSLEPSRPSQLDCAFPLESWGSSLIKSPVVLVPSKGGHGHLCDADVSENLDSEVSSILEASTSNASAKIQVTGSSGDTSPSPMPTSAPTSTPTSSSAAESPSPAICNITHRSPAASSRSPSPSPHREIRDHLPFKAHRPGPLNLGSAINHAPPPMSPASTPSNLPSRSGPRFAPSPRNVGVHGLLSPSPHFNLVHTLSQLVATSLFDDDDDLEEMITHVRSMP